MKNANFVPLKLNRKNKKVQSMCKHCRGRGWGCSGGGALILIPIKIHYAIRTTEETINLAKIVPVPSRFSVFQSTSTIISIEIAIWNLTVPVKEMYSKMSPLRPLKVKTTLLLY